MKTTTDQYQYQIGDKVICITGYPFGSAPETVEGIVIETCALPNSQGITVKTNRSTIMTYPERLQLALTKKIEELL